MNEHGGSGMAGFLGDAIRVQEYEIAVKAGAGEQDRESSGSEKRGLRSELELRSSVTAPSQEGLWYSARHHRLSVNRGANNASSASWEETMCAAGVLFEVRCESSPVYVQKYVNAQEASPSMAVLHEFCRGYPGRQEGAQILMDEDERVGST